MRVFILAPLQDDETFIAIKEAFENLKIECLAVDISRHEQAFEIMTANGRWDLLLCSRSMECYETVVKAKKYTKTKTACWNVDTRVPIERWGALLLLFQEVDYLFDVSEGQLEEWRKWNKKTYYLQQGLHDRKYYPVLPTYAEMEHYSCQVGFMGNLHPEIHSDRQRLLDLVGAEHSLKKFSGVFGHQHNIAAGTCLINLCHSVYPEVKNSYSVRNWKILGAGGVGVDLYHEGIEKTFHKGIEHYKTIEEAPEVIKYMLKHYDRYRERAQRAHKWVLANATYTKRIAEMMRIIG